MRRFIVVVALALALAAPAQVHASQAPSAEQYYESAIEAMRHLPQPSIATYNVHVHVTGTDFVLSREPNGEASVGFVLGVRGAKPDATFAAAYRKRDDLTSVHTPDGGWGVIHSPLFDPTWSGIDDWIKYGFNGSSHTRPARPSPSPLPDGLAVIAAVRTMGVAFYNVADAGAASCANGDPGHRVHLIAREDPLTHPLTDAVIDERTNHLCFVRLAAHQSIVAAGYDASIELNIADANGMSLVRSGTAQLTLRAMSLPVKRIAVTFAYDRFAFPAHLADDVFPEGVK